jgi:hypothetical protein
MSKSNKDGNLPESASQLVKDGLPSFYVSREGQVCTHRMSDLDTPVWCKSTNDSLAVMYSVENMSKRILELCCMVRSLQTLGAQVCLELPRKLNHNQERLLRAVNKCDYSAYRITDAEKKYLQEHIAEESAQAVEEAAKYMLEYLGISPDITSVSKMALYEYAGKIRAKAGLL